MERKILFLQKQLNNLLNSNFMSFDNLKSLKSSGVYVIIDGNIPIYVGKTKRKGKTRLREMISDFRSHTFNRKLMTEELNRKFKLNLGRLKNKDKEDLIKQIKITEDEFKKCQITVNNKIKNKFKIKFIEVSGKQLIDLEHFAIGVLSPIYND